MTVKPLAPTSNCWFSAMALTLRKFLMTSNSISVSALIGAGIWSSASGKGSRFSGSGMPCATLRRA